MVYSDPLKRNRISIFPSSYLGQEDPLEEGIATCSSILAWKIPWTEEPGGLQHMGSQRVGHDWVRVHTHTHSHTHTHTHPTCNEFLIESHTPLRLKEVNQLVGKKLEQVKKMWKIQRERGEGWKHKNLDNYVTLIAKNQEEIMGQAQAWNSSWKWENVCAGEPTIHVSLRWVR